MSITRTPHGPTAVLVHGAFAESSSRDGVVDLLLEDDVPVLAVASPQGGSRAVAVAEAGAVALVGDAARAASRADGRVDVERLGVGS